jgi:uridine monophosphate synthetase
MKKVACLLSEKVNSIPHHFLCGIPYAALPITTALSLLLNDPMLMVRKEGAKTYGTKQVVEGIYTSGDNVLVIEDIITTGQSIQETINKLTAEGLTITDIMVIVDRQQGGREKLTAMGYSVHSLFTLDELLTILYTAGKIDGSFYENFKKIN